METFLLSACRTPIGAFGGALEDHSAVDLGTIVIRVASYSTSGVDPAIMGMVSGGGMETAMIVERV